MADLLVGSPALSIPGGIRLRDYQEHTVAQLLDPPADVWRDLAVLATGGGKTIVFAKVLHHLIKPGRRGLVLAHREELLTQARDKIAMVDASLSVELEQSALRASRDLGLFANSTRSVVVGSVPSLHKKRREQFAPDAFDVIIVDEAHHATSDSYVDIFEYFGCFDPQRRTRLIGVTATPNRTDGKGLGSVFQRIAAVYGIKELVDQGYLVAPRAVRVNTRTDLSQVKMTAGDFNLGQLEDAVNTEDRNELIVASYKRFAPDRQGMVFTTGVEHAKTLADLFNSYSIPSAAIWGAMGDNAKDEVLTKFDRGDLQALMTFGMLLEGYDNPRVSAVVLGRPTPSSLLVTQMVGRGLRLFEGKSDCVCIDVQDVTTKTRCVSVPTLAGLPRDFDAAGENIFKAKTKYDELDPRIASKATTLQDVDELLARAKEGMTVVEVNLLEAAPDPVVSQSSKFLWSPIGADVYRLVAGNDMFGVQANTLGRWAAAFRRQDGTLEALAIDLPDAASAFAIADNYIAENYDTRLLDRTARWRQKPASEQQIGFMVRLGLLSSVADAPESLRKGQASSLIDEALAAKKRGERVRPLYFA
jgi:ATP-dependent helicase IRC3